MSERLYTFKISKHRSVWHKSFGMYSLPVLSRGSSFPRSPPLDWTSKVLYVNLSRNQIDFKAYSINQKRDPFGSPSKQWRQNTTRQQRARSSVKHDDFCLSRNITSHTL